MNEEYDSTEFKHLQRTTILNHIKINNEALAMLNDDAAAAEEVGTKDNTKWNMHI